MPPTARRSLTLCVFIDAFGWALLQKNHFLEDLLPARSPLQTVLGYSSTCDPTILTGLDPQDHQHFSFFYYNPRESPFRGLSRLGILPKQITSRARVRRVMSRLLQKQLGYTGYFQIYNVPFKLLKYFDYSEKRDLYEPGGINGGQETLFDLLRRDKIPYSCSNWRLPEEQNLAELQTRIEEGKIRFAYLYLASMDGLLHSYGTDAPCIQEKIAWYDQQLRALIAKAKERYDSVDVMIFSDHGMANVESTLDVRAAIEPLGLEFGKDYAAVYDSTMARFWFLRSGAREKIEAALQKLKGGHVLTDQNLADYGCSFPERKYGELFFLADSGVLICPSFMGERPIKGMHGYAPEATNSVAMYATNNTEATTPKRLQDLFERMRQSIYETDDKVPAAAQSK